MEPLTGRLFHIAEPWFLHFLQVLAQNVNLICEGFPDHCHMASTSTTWLRFVFSTQQDISSLRAGTLFEWPKFRTLWIPHDKYKICVEWMNGEQDTWTKKYQQVADTSRSCESRVYRGSIIYKILKGSLAPETWCGFIVMLHLLPCHTEAET